MRNPAQITSHELTTIQQILQKYLSKHAIVWVFGSRTSKNVKKFSDLDLAIDNNEPLPYSTYVSLKCDFEDSDLPFKVDLVDWYTLDQSFQQRISLYKTTNKIEL